jgi:hypothetical protein
MRPRFSSKPPMGPMGMHAVSRAVVMVASLIGPVVVGAGCGDLSQEDLLFRAGVPAKEAVAVVPPGIEAEVDDALSSSSQALSSRRQALEERCDGDLLCETRNLARTFNGLTFFLLDIVDTISALPPSERSPGRRIWGPHFESDKGTTFRFEMTRSDDGATFSFCLHAARGFVGRAPDVDCTVAEDAATGLQRLLSGSFSPSGIAGANARLGTGTMQLETERLNRLNGEPRIARIVDIAFDHQDGQTDLHIDLLGTSADAVDRDASYDFARSAEGDGTLAFDFFADLAQGDALFDERALERVRLRAAWGSDRAGRAIGVVDGGNTTAPVSVEQCWDASLATVYRQDVSGAETGDVGLCATDAPIVP